jgi:hypothetical protein
MKLKKKEFIENKNQNQHLKSINFYFFQEKIFIKKKLNFL